MTEEQKTKTSAPAPKVKTVQEHMENRAVFATTELAFAYLTALGQTLEDFAVTPLAAVGLSDAGIFDPAIYTDKMDVMVSTLKSQGDAAKGIPSGVRAVVVTPSPKLESFIDNPTARAWLEKILHKEINHVAVRSLRTAADISTVLDQMPSTLDGFIASGRESGSSVLEAFNSLHAAISKHIGSKIPAWARTRIVKAELRQCLANTAYALAHYPQLENRGEKPSAFVIANMLFIAEANKQGLDASVFTRWAANRDTAVYQVPVKDEDSEDDFGLDLDSLSAGITG